MKVVHSLASSTKFEEEALSRSPQANLPLCDDIDTIPPPPMSETESDASPIENAENCDQTSIVSLGRDSFGSDEWENDDDLGYVIIQLSEEEFIEMEQVRFFFNFIISF
jgi:hypothetical protein